MRASVASLLIVGCAGVDKFAAIQKLKSAGKSKAGSATLARVASLLEKVADNPQAMGAFHEAMSAASLDLNNVIQKVQVGYESTIDAIAEKISAVESSSATCQAKYGDANDAAESFWNEVSKLRDARVEVESKVADHNQAVADEVTPNNNLQDAKPFSAEVNLKPFSCDIESQGGACKLDTYNTESEQAVSSQKGVYNDRLNHYNAMKKAHDEALQAIEDAKEAEETAIADWKTQRTAAHEAAGDRSTALCNFGTHYQTKCEKVQDYNALLENIQGEGTEFSYSDRQTEYYGLKLTQCVLDQLANSGLDNFVSIYDNCAMLEPYSINDYEHAESAWVLKPHTYDPNGDFLKYTSGDYFSCDESVITFDSGKHWNIPAWDNDQPAASEYSSKEGHTDSVASLSTCE